MARRSRQSRLGPVVGGAVVIVIAGGVLLHFRNAMQTQAEGSASAAFSGLPPLPSAGFGDGGTGSHVKDVLLKTSLADALAYTKPLMADTWDRLDEGAALLALWSSQHLTWDDLDKLPETSPALYRKDPMLERGRRFCISGTISEIRAENDLEQRMISDHALPLVAPQPTQTSMGMSGMAPIAPLAEAGADDTDGGLPNLEGGSLAPPTPPEDWHVPDGGKVFFAVVTTGSKKVGSSSSDDADAGAPLVVSAIAVRSTGDLVDGSKARICGILTGVNSIASDMSGSTLSHRIVGMFDLPENHAPLPAPKK